MLVAVELVLESDVPSVEHVMNVLTRLNQSPPPEQVETSLKLAEEPLANTIGYMQDVRRASEHSRGAGSARIAHRPGFV